MERLPEFIGNHLFLTTLFIAILSMLLWNLFGNALSGIKQINPAEVTRMINHENAIVLDIRTSADFNAGHILNAVNLPDSEIAERQKELEKYRDHPIILYCSNGSVSTRVARTMKMQGNDKVYCLSGGLQAWQSANLPLTR